MTAQLTGDKELIRRLNELGTRGAKKATRAGIRAAMTPVAKACRAAVNAASVSMKHSSDGGASLKRAARKAVIANFSTRTGVAKVGWPKDVKASKGKRRAAHERAASTKSGVGISISNIHWFVLGTSERSTAKRRTGRIDSVLADVIPKATMQSAGASVEAARRKIQEVIEREARKRA